MDVVDGEWSIVPTPQQIVSNVEPKKKRTKKVIQTPKLTEKDRVKLIDRPEMLMVAPKTYPASVRYGSGSRWCTSIPSGRSFFDKYTKLGFLVYIIYYETLEGKRGVEKTKVALYVNPEPNRQTIIIEGWSKKDNRIEADITENIILTPEMRMVLKDYSNQYLLSKFKMVIGSKVFLNHGKVYGKFDLIKAVIGDEKWALTIYLLPSEIAWGIVTKINERSVRMNIKEVKLNSSLPKHVTDQITDQIKKDDFNINIKTKYLLL